MSFSVPQLQFPLKTLFFACFFFICQAGFAQDCNLVANCGLAACATQELGCKCADGSDNDGDGKIDKADENCASYYGLTFVGDGSDCSITPPGNGNPFDLINAPVESSQNTADTQSKVSVGDVDADGIPDAIITSKWNSEIRVVATRAPQADGTKAGDIKSSFNLSGNEANTLFNDLPTDKDDPCTPDRLLFEHENLIANIDPLVDSKGEMFGIVSNRSGNPSTPPTCFYLVGFKYATGKLVPLFKAVNLGTNRPGTFGIADMDGDGKAEIYMRDRIYAAETGKLIAQGGGNWDVDVTSAPVAVQISGDNKLELVTGTKIYGIPSLTDRTGGTVGTLSLLHDMNATATDKCYVKLMLDPVEYGEDTHSSTSVADIDNDGNIDVVISGALNANSGKTAVFYWNVAKNKVSYYLPIDPDNINGWPWGTGRVNLIDTDKDGLLDMFFVAGNQLYRLETIGDTFSPTINSAQTGVTKRTINDSRSGVLTVTLYDFDNDTNFELVYRDSQELAVVDALTLGTKYWSATCQSHTYTEGPIIADVNGDGGTDICVSCNTSNKFDITDPIQQQALGQFRLYYSSANDWLPTRKVWNQPGYFVVNVNDNLTLPFPQRNQTMVYGTGACDNGMPGPQRPLNVFMDQIPNLSADGCPIFPRPNLTFTGDTPSPTGVDEDGDGSYDPTVVVIPPICGDLDIDVYFQIVNDGYLPITANVPVSFFNGNPTVAGATLLHSATLNIVNLAVGAEYISPTITFNGPGTVFQLYILLNNNGAVLPVTLSSASATECSLVDNLYNIQVAPDPFTVQVVPTPNTVCGTDTGNGVVQAKVFKNGVEVADYSPFTVQWYAGPSTGYTIINGATNFSMSSLKEGDYTVIVTNTAKGCTSAPIHGTVLKTEATPEVSIDVVQVATKCTPPDGILEAVVADGNYAGVTFVWRELSGTPLGITTSTAPNLPSGNYTVTATRGSCSDIADIFLDGPSDPVATAQKVSDVVDCLNPNSGSITATATINDVPQDPANYTFTWYFYNNATSTRGSVLPAANGTGPTRTGLGVGYYEVVVTQNNTQCVSGPIPPVQVQSMTVVPSVIIEEVTPQTSCDPTQPNGVIRAVATATGLTSPNDFTFTWYDGQNTVDVVDTEVASGTNGFTLTKVAGGGVSYTVKATTSLNCSATDDHVITEILTRPVVTLDSVNNGICDKTLTNPAVEYSGEVTATVTLGGVVVNDFTNYEITWYEGDQVIDPVMAGETGLVIDGLIGGQYTMVVEKTDDFCISDPVTIQVLNQTTLPVIEMDSIPSTNCLPTPGNGQAMVVDVDGAGTGSPYVYQWHTGINTASPIVGATLPVLANRQGGLAANFTVLVTDQSSGCQSTGTVLVPDQKALPLFTLDPEPNTVCDETLTVPSISFSGSVTTTITNQGTTPITDYKFKWTDDETGTVIVNDVVGAAGKDIANRDSSEYTLVITRISTGCVSNPVTAEVIIDVDLPVIDADANASTSCDPAKANGGVQVNFVDLIAPPNNHSFEWYRGNTVGNNPADIIALTAVSPDTIQGAVGNFFTVLVTDLSDGCQSTKVVEVADNRVLPLFTLLPSPNGICDPDLTTPRTEYNGEVEVTITNQGTFPITDYLFDWTDEETGTLIFDDVVGGSANAELLTGRDSSNYELVITQISSGCISDPVSAEVINDVDLPGVDAEAIASTSCDPAKANGSVFVEFVDGIAPPNNHNFEWYSGDEVGNNPADIVALTAVSPDTIQGGVGHFFTVLVTDRADGCQSTAIVEVPDNHVLPLFTLDPSPNSICNPSLTVPTQQFDGEIDVTITNQGANPINDYRFDWTDDETNTLIFNDLVGGTANSDLLTQRDSSDYTLVITQESTGCESDPVSTRVTATKVLPLFEADANGSTNCESVAGNGGVQVFEVETLAPPNNHTFAWYSGSTPAAMIPANLIASTFASPDTLQGDVGNFFIVLVTDLADGCQSTKVVEVPDEHVLPLFTLNPSPNSICNPSLTFPAQQFDGEVGVTITNQGATLINDYRFDWTDEETGTLIFNDLVGGTANAELLTQRDSSDYTLVITQASTGCESDPVTARVTSTKVLPVFEADANGSTNCETVAGNGGVQVFEVETLVPPNNHTFEWYAGSTAAAMIPANLIASDFASPDTLQGGVGNFFIALVTDLADGCQSTKVVEVPDEHVLPLFTLDPSPNSICDPDKTSPRVEFDGEVQVTITNQGLNPIGDYLFDWTDEETGTLIFNDVVGGTVNAELLTERDSSDYTLVITQASTGCASDPVTAQVTANKVLPVFNAIGDASTNCETVAGNGHVRIVDVEGAAAPNNHTFEWYRGSGLAALVAGNLVANTEISPDTLQGAPGQFYTVVVTDNADGCEKSEAVELPHLPVIPLFTLAATPNTICDPSVTDPVGAAYDGQLDATITNMGAAAIEDYHFEWTNEETGLVEFDEDGGGATFGESLAQVDSGFYSLVVTQISTGCSTASVQGEVPPDFTFPDIDIAEVPQTSCNASSPNGVLTATVGGSNANDTFLWEESNVPGGVDVATTTATAGQIDQLPGNVYYTITAITKATGCLSYESVYLNETIVTPTVVLNGVLPQESCDNPDGSVTATASPILSAPNTTYEFYWMREQALTTTTDPDDVINEATTNLGPGATTGFYNRAVTGGAGVEVDVNPNLVHGTYTMVVRDTYTECVSTTYTIAIPDNTTSTVNITFGALPSTCNDTGSLTINAERTDLVATNFTFDLFKGGPVNTTLPIDYYSNPTNPPIFNTALNPDGGDADALADPLETVAAASGANVTTSASFVSFLYTVIATDDEGCKTMEDFYLPFADAHSITSAFQDSKICPYTEGDGTITFRAVYPPAGSPRDDGNQSDYEFIVYAGGAAVAGNEITMPPPTGTSPIFITSEVDGDAIDNDADGTMDEVEALVNATNPHTWPVSTETCNDGTDDDGDLLVDADDPDCQAYVSLVNLAPGFYTIEVMETFSGNDCRVQQVIQINPSALEPVISLVGNLVANSACDVSAADGEIEFNIAAHPDDPNFAMYDYDILMTPDPDGDFPPLNNQVAGNYTADNLPPDSYTFTVTASSGCSSTKTYEILDQPNIGQMVSGNVSVTDAEYCDPALEQSARIEVTLISVTDTDENCTNGLDDDGDGFTDGMDPDCDDDLDDYEFTWYKDAALTQIVLGPTDGDDSGTDGGEVLSNVGSPAPGEDITVGTYYVVAKKEDVGSTGGVGCFSAPFKVDIGDKTVNPIATLYPFGDTSCDGAFEGSIEVEVSTATLGLAAPYTNPGASSNYEYQWDPANPIALGTTDDNTGNRVNAGDDDVVSNLEPGTYDLTIVNEETGCFVELGTIIDKASPPIFTLDLSSTPQVICDPDGTVTINDALLDGVSDGTGNFEYTYFLDDPASAALAVPNTTVLLDDAVYPAIGAGSYYIVAKRKLNTAPGSGCSSAPQRIDIGDDSIDPIAVLTPASNTSCATMTFEGSLNVEVTDPGSAAAATGYTYTWDIGNPSAIVSAGGNDGDGLLADDNKTGLKDGVYNVIIENDASGCVFIGQKTILKTEIPIIVTQATPVEQDICDPDGSITVDDVSVGGADEPDLTFFDFTWYRDDTSNEIVPATTNETVLDINNYATIGWGTYLVKAKRTSGSPGFECESAPLTVLINDETEDPMAVLTPLSNTSCATMVFEGSINIEVTDPGSAAAATGYTYTWSVGNPSVIASAGGNDGDGLLADDNKTGLKDGVYNVVIENDASGCVFNGQTTILKTEIPIIITQATPVEQDICDPDGSITVDDVSVGGLDEPDLSFFDFTWYSNNISTQIVPPTANETVLDINNYATIGAGTYLVKAKRTSGTPGFECESAPLTVLINDETENPTAVVTPFANTSCSTTIFEGSIEIEVTDPGSAPATTGYTYTWDASNPTAIGNSSANDGDADGTDGDDDNPGTLNDGVYKLIIENDDTGCITAKETTITKTELPVIIARATPTGQFMCDPDGSIQVDEILVDGVEDLDHTNFDFTWYRNNLSTKIIDDVNGEDFLDVNDLANISAGTYFVEIQRLSTANPGADCKSAPLRIDIENNTIKPTVVLTPFSNTSCSQITFEGSIAVEVTNDGSVAAATGFTYTWSASNPSLIGASSNNDGDGDGSDGDGDNPLDLKDGVYSLTVENDASGCTKSAQTTILLTELPVIIARATPVPQTLCDPSGSITVDQVLVDGILDGNHANFDFTWFRNNLSTIIINDVNDADVLSVTNLPTISAGTYFVQLQRLSTVTPGADCKSAPVRVDIEDNTVKPSVTLTPFTNTACNGNYEGSILVDVTDPGSGPVTLTYNYDWNESTNPTDIEGGLGPVTANDNGTGPDDNPTGLQDGEYTVTVINPQSGCERIAETTITHNPEPVSILDVDQVDQLICLPDGSITVTAVSPSLVTDYTFKWFINDTQSDSLTNGGLQITDNILDVNNYATIEAGTYFVIGTKNDGVSPGSGCDTPPFRIDLLDLHADPQMEITSVANSACDNALANGMLFAAANEPDGTLGDYTFQWELAAVILRTGPANNHLDTLTNALDGNYIITATNQSTGCPVTRGYTLELDQTRSTPNIIDVITTHPFDCNPTGTAEVTKITLGSTSNSVLQPPAIPPDNEVTGVDLLSFEYEWYIADTNPGSQLPLGGPFTITPLITGLTPATYYVMVTDPGTACKSTPKEVVINDDDIVYPLLEISQSGLQIGCLPIGTGELTATADVGLPVNSVTVPTNYEFFWFANLTADGTRLNPSSTAVLGDLADGEYSVEVRDLTTNCTSEGFYIILDQADQYKPIVSLSTDGRTNCDDPNGVLQAREIGFFTHTDYPFPANFTTEYYVGSGADTSVPGQLMDPTPLVNLSWTENSMDINTYTVKITDNNTECFTVAEIVLPDERVLPVVVVREDNPLINCDENSNGQLSATADNGQIGGFTFSWASVNAPSTVLSTSEMLTGQTIGDYTVTVRNETTGCINDETGTITDGRLYPPSPDVVVVQDRGHCINPDGWLAANVDGITFNYSFDWYDGSADGSIEYNGTDYKELDINTYQVTATDEVTGCTSEPATADIKDIRVYPELFFRTTPSYCEELPESGFAGNGTVDLEFTPSNIISDSVIWFSGTTNSDPVAGIGSYLRGVLPGIYTAELTTIMGCVATGSAEVKTEILEYNLVTENGDGKNDVFKVDCISRFPNNNVKIFNRSGVLVYEADGYNNNDVVFSGEGTKGVYATGNNLPVGTYFYIIDKRDGSKPKTGYLELAK